jgi:hypothetical protein
VGVVETLERWWSDLFGSRGKEAAMSEDGNARAGAGDPVSAVTELFDTWDAMVGRLSEASIESIKKGKSAWEKMTGPEEYGTTDALRDSAEAFAIGVNAWRLAMGEWFRYTDPARRREPE